MSELMNERSRNKDFRRNLLTNVSLFALLGYLGISAGAHAASTEQEDQPIVWVELGGQFERMDSAQTPFAPLFVATAPQVDQDAMIDAQQPSPYSIGGEAKITFAPEATNWLFSAAIRYGRSNSAKHLHHETKLPTISAYVQVSNVLHIIPPNRIFGDGQSDSGASHYVLDFQAGRDVGLGLFGAGGSSVVSAGVRFAQFTSHSNVTLHARPTYFLVERGVPGKYKLFHDHFNNNTAVLHAARDAHAIGPSVSWDASLPVIRNEAGMKLTVDWGANAAILFGRQRVRIHHQTSGTYESGIFTNHVVSSYAKPPVDPVRSRTVTIPNVGGFAGVTFRKGITKISLGYRADFFFGAMDGGIDTAKKENIGFYGPFATISVGIGG